MKVFVIDVAGLGQGGLNRHARCLGSFSGHAHGLIPVQVVFVELFLREVKCFGKLDCYLLLLEENKFVVLHVFLGVGFQVGTQFVQVQAVFVVALLVVQEKLTEFRRAERRSYHSVIQHELVN